MGGINRKKLRNKWLKYLINSRKSGKKRFKFE